MCRFKTYREHHLWEKTCRTNYYASLVDKFYSLALMFEVLKRFIIGNMDEVRFLFSAILCSCIPNAEEAGLDPVNV
jgi:hypothetical protein